MAAKFRWSFKWLLIPPQTQGALTLNCAAYRHRDESKPTNDVTYFQPKYWCCNAHVMSANGQCWATISNIKCDGQLEIDLLAINPVSLARYHIETSISGSHLMPS